MTLRKEPLLVGVLVSANLPENPNPTGLASKTKARTNSDRPVIVVT